MTEWKVVKIAELGEVVGGATPSTSCQDYYNGEIPWLTPKDLADYKYRYISRGERNITSKGLDSCSTKIVPKNTVLFTSRAPIGYVAIASNEMCTNQGFKSVIPNDKTDFMFLYYLLVYNKEKIESVASGTTFKEVSGATMRNIEVRVPSLDVQKKIAKILSALDDKIELNNRINKNLEAQALVIVENYIETTSECVNLGKVLKFANGFPFQSNSYIEKGKYKIITIKNVQDGLIDSTGSSHIDQLPLRMNSDCLLELGDVLVSLTGNVGRVGIVCENNLLLNQRVAKLLPYNFAMLPFLYFYFRLPSTKRELEKIAKGTAQQNLSPVEALKLEMRCDSNAQLVSQKLAGKFNAILNNHKQNILLSKLRDTLLPKLMSGELDVENLNV